MGILLDHRVEQGAETEVKVFNSPIDLCYKSVVQVVTERMRSRTLAAEIPILRRRSWLSLRGTARSSKIFGELRVDLLYLLMERNE